MTATIGPGSVIGPYEVRSTLGEGGMGVVYRARDTRLHRDVALKCLRPDVAADPDRIARFRQEAEVLASLNHPNIAAIYGVEEVGGTVALVLEIVEGPTLGDVIAAQPLPMARVLAIAVQIAGAIEAAHQHGIVHRDLKPSNIKLAAHDTVKVLDFGLAKVRDIQTASANAQTVLATSPGMIAGTTAYMSPEQARGDPATHSTDIWAFGCVLFEMLTATRAFDGPTATDTLGRVMEAEPDWAKVPPQTPPAIGTLLRRSLRKDPRHRLQHIGDARIEIDEALREPHAVAASTKPAAAASSRIERVGWLAALTAVGAIAAAGVTGVFRDESPSPQMRLDIAAPPTTSPSSIAMAPDGQSVAFAGLFEGVSHLWLRSLATVESRRFAGTAGAQYPFWSPDGLAIGFFADGMLKRIDVASGVVQPITSVSVATGGTWNREGVILFSGSTVGPILRVPAGGGQPAAVTSVKPPGETFHSTPYFLPDGRQFLYHVTGAPTSRGIYVGRLDGGPPTRVLERDAPALFAAPGRIVFVDRGTLYSQPFDPDRLVISGEPAPIAEQVMIEPIGVVPAVSVSAVGSILYRTGTTAGQRQFIWFDRAGRESGRLGSPDSATAQNPSQSPDGTMVALNRTLNGNSDVWLLETARGLLTRFTVTDTIDVNPTWSPDGAYIAYGSNRRGVFDVYRKRIASAEPEELLATGEGSKAPLDWSRDGRVLLYRTQHPKNGWDVMGVSIGGERRTFPVIQTEFEETNAQFSADGRWIAYQSNESGNVEIYVRSFPDPGTKVRVSITGGTQPRWRQDGLELFYVALDGRLMAVPLTTESGKGLQAGSPTSLFSTSIGSMGQGAQRQQYMVSNDGQRFLVNTVPDANTPITILLNSR